MVTYNISNMDGLYIAYNKEADSRILIGVSRHIGENTVRDIAETYRIDMNMSGKFDEIEPLPKNLNALKGIEFTCGYLLTEETYYTGNTH